MSAKSIPPTATGKLEHTEGVSPRRYMLRIFSFSPFAFILWSFLVIVFMSWSLGTSGRKFVNGKSLTKKQPVIFNRVMELGIPSEKSFWIVFACWIFAELIYSGNDHQHFGYSWLVNDLFFATGLENIWSGIAKINSRYLILTKSKSLLRYGGCRLSVKVRVLFRCTKEGKLMQKLSRY